MSEGLKDLNSKVVEVEIRDDGKVLWVHADEGISALRISGIEDLRVIDHREDK